MKNNIIFSLSTIITAYLLVSACAPKIKQLPYRQSYPVSPTIEEIIKVNEK